jgi:hypothetical protein
MTPSTWTARDLRDAFINERAAVLEYDAARRARDWHASSTRETRSRRPRAIAT